MSENENLAPVLTRTNSLALDPNIKQQLSTWEDHVNYYVLLEEASNTASWIKADVLLNLIDKFGDESINNFAGQINQKGATVTNYIRVAKAFPPETRNPMVSFSNHFQASFADSYDSNSKEFIGEKRFEWIEKAAEEGYSTRKLQDEIQHEKEKEKKGVDIVPCYKCGKNDGEIMRCVFYVFGNRNKAERFELHKGCYEQVVEFAHGNQTV